MSTADDPELLADRLHSAAIHLLRDLRREDRRAGIGPARLSALSVLVFGGARTSGELAAAEGVRAPTMSRIIRGLEAGGLVRRGADPEDGRAVLVRATARGRRVLEAARRRRLGRLVKRLEALPAGERARLQAALPPLERLAGRPARRS